MYTDATDAAAAFTVDSCEFAPAVEPPKNVTNLQNNPCKRQPA